MPTGTLVGWFFDNTPVADQADLEALRAEVGPARPLTVILWKGLPAGTCQFLDVPAHCCCLCLFFPLILWTAQRRSRQHNWTRSFCAGPVVADVEKEDAAWLQFISR